MGRVQHKRGDPQDGLVHENKKDEILIAHTIESIQEKNANEFKSTGDSPRHSTQDDVGEREDRAPAVTDSSKWIRKLNQRHSIKPSSKGILRLRERRQNKGQNQVHPHVSTAVGTNIRRTIISKGAQFDFKEDKSQITPHPPRVDDRRTVSVNMKQFRRRVIEAITPNRFRTDCSSSVIRKGELAKMLLASEGSNVNVTTINAVNHVSPMILENQKTRRRSIHERMRALELHLDGYSDDESFSGRILAVKPDDSPITNIPKSEVTKSRRSLFVKTSNNPENFSIASWFRNGYDEQNKSDYSCQIYSTDDDEPDTLNGTFSNGTSFTDGISYDPDDGISSERGAFNCGSETDEESFTDGDGGGYTDDDGSTMGDTDNDDGSVGSHEHTDDEYLDSDDETCTNTVEHTDSKVLEGQKIVSSDKDISAAFSLLSFIM